MTIERIKEALRDAGWGPRLYDDGHMIHTPTGRIALYVYACAGVWTASPSSGAAASGPNPITAIRRLYARSDSRRLRAALRPALVELREPESERYDVVISQVVALPSSRWLDRVRLVAPDLLPHLPDAADRYLLAISIAGDPPDEIYDAVTALRARLEEMG